MVEPSCLILAGYRGAGKSTLLRRALGHSTPIFGERFQPVVKSARLAPDDREWLTPPDIAMREGYVFATPHLPYLHSLASFPRSIIVTVDLVTLSVAEAIYLALDAPPGIRALFPRTIGSMRNKNAHRQIYEAAFPEPFLGRFGAVVVNTVYAPFDEIISRETVLKTKDHGELFADNEKNRSCHGAIYAAWFSFLKRRKIDAQFLTIARGGGFEIAERGRAGHFAGAVGGAPRPTPR